jgi:hypothetical protein
MALKVVLSVKEAWIVADSLREKRDYLRSVMDGPPESPINARSYVRQDLEAIEETMAKLLSPDSWTD